MDEEESADSLPNDSSATAPEDIIAETVLEHDNKLNYLHDKLAEQQKTLSGILKLLKAQTRSLSGQAPSPWNLKDGTGEQQRKILRQLQDWIDWYNQTYPGVEEHLIPPCWFRHPAVVQELLAVFVAWQAAYCGLVDPDDAPAYWHERILHPTIARLCVDKAAGWGNCLGAHREPHGVTVEDTDAEAFRSWLQGLNRHRISVHGSLANRSG